MEFATLGVPKKNVRFKFERIYYLFGEELELNAQAKRVLFEVRKIYVKFELG